MTAGGGASCRRPDELLEQIADYVNDFRIDSEEAISTARLCLMDSLGCALLALNYTACTKLLGPIVPGAVLPGGARVPGTGFEIDPVQAAFNIGCQIRWLDFNDTWLALEWGHPSDNLGAVLACSDYVCRKRRRDSVPPLPVRHVLEAMIQAHEIQGVLALGNAFNRVGLDHVLLVRVASTAVATKLLGGSQQQVIDAISNAWLDGGALRTYRHAPNTGSRKSWAAGDATSRGVRLALMTLAGEMGYCSPLTAELWGFQDVLFKGDTVRLPQALGSTVMENVLFKISYPAEFHGQTAVEAAVHLHPAVTRRLDEIDRVVIDTQEPAMRIINKTGPLHNPADRDHCIQYMVAVALVHGTLTADHYEDDAARDGRFDALRAKMQVREDKQFSADYLAPDKRSIANAVQVFFTAGTQTEHVEIHYPLGHRRRRAEAVPLIRQKFEANILTRFDAARSKRLLDLFDDPERLDAMPVDEFMALFVP